jgi:hypothetical protein
MEITGSKINEWIQADRKRKARAERRGELFGHVRSGVRSIFIFLFIAAILVFAFNHQTEIQTLAYAKLERVIKHSPSSDKLRQSAINYEKQVDNIAK